MVENWGNGVFSACLEMSKRNSLARERKADESSVTLTFRAKGDVPQLESKEKGKEKSKEKILSYLSANPDATTGDLIEVTGLSTSGVEKNIRELKASGRLKRVGADKGGNWEVVASGSV